MFYVWHLEMWKKIVFTASILYFIHRDCKQKANIKVWAIAEGEEMKRWFQIIKWKSSFRFFRFSSIHVITQIIHSWLELFVCICEVVLFFADYIFHSRILCIRSFLCFRFSTSIFEEITSNKSVIHKLYDNRMKCSAIFVIVEIGGCHLKLKILLLFAFGLDSDSFLLSKTVFIFDSIVPMFEII